MVRPIWQVADSPSMSVRIKAKLYVSQGFNKLRDVNALDLLPEGRWIQFRATTSNGLPLIGEEYDGSVADNE